MRFKRNGIYIFLLLFVLGVIAVSCIVMASSGAFTMFFLLYGLLLIALLLAVLDFFGHGLFSSTIYYNKQGIRYVSRKETIEYEWEKIRRIEPIVGGRGPIGWRIVPYSGKEILCYPFSAKFIKFVKSELPWIEFKT